MCCVTCLCIRYMYSAEHGAGKWQVLKHGGWVGWSYWRWPHSLSLAWETRPLLQCYWIILGFFSLLTGGISSCDVTAWKRGNIPPFHPTSELLITSWPPSLTLCPEIPDAIRTITWIVNFFPHNWLAFPVKTVSCHTQKGQSVPTSWHHYGQNPGSCARRACHQEMAGHRKWGQYLFLNKRERTVSTRSTKMVLMTQVLILFGEVVTGDRGGRQGGNGRGEQRNAWPSLPSTIDRRMGGAFSFLPFMLSFLIFHTLDPQGLPSIESSALYQLDLVLRHPKQPHWHKLFIPNLICDCTSRWPLGIDQHPVTICAS